MVRRVDDDQYARVEQLRIPRDAACAECRRDCWVESSTYLPTCDTVVPQPVRDRG